MQFFTLSVVVILGFASYGPAGTAQYVGFPTRSAENAPFRCAMSTLGTHQVTYSDIQTLDSRYFHRQMVAGLDWISSSESKIFLDPGNAAANPFNINSQPDCAMVVSANGYNSFVYNTTHCIGFSYQASACRVGPRIGPGDTGPFFEIFVANAQRANATAYVARIGELAWLAGEPNTLSTRLLIDGLYADLPVTHVIARLNNGSETIFFDVTSPMDIKVPIDGDCTGQDLTILIMNNDQVLDTQFLERDVCPEGAIDTCTGCVTPLATSRSAAADGKLSYRSLEEGCKQIKSHSVPIITSETRRDQILSYMESDPDMSPDSFWVGFSRSAESSSFSWPDGSKDLSMFGNGKSFTPRSGEDCSTAYVDVVSMELMIESASCAQKRAGFCVM